MSKLSNRQIKSLIKQTASSFSHVIQTSSDSRAVCEAAVQKNALLDLLQSIENLENR